MRAEAQEGKREDLVHFGDLIDVDLIGSFEFDWRGTLTPDGHLDGVDGYSEPIYALCRSESQIAADIVRVFSKILRNPRVKVKILDRSNRALARVDGAVRTPTRFSIRRKVRLNELIVLAGGLTDAASGEVTIFRPQNVRCDQTPVESRAQTTVVKLSDLLTGKPAANPEIASGDLVTVTKALPVYVIGAVNNPRPIYSRDQSTVLRVIATAGGLAKDADGRKATILRRNGLEMRTIDVDLAKIKRGESKDEILRPFDILDVASRGGGKRRYPPIAVSEENKGVPRAELPLKVVD